MIPLIWRTVKVEIWLIFPMIFYSDNLIELERNFKVKYLICNFFQMLTNNQLYSDLRD